MGILDNIENLGDISSVLQSYAFEYLGVLSKVFGRRDFEWIWVSALSLVDSVHSNNGKLENRHLDLLDEIIEELKLQRDEVHNNELKQKVDEVLAYLAAAKSASEDGNYSLVKENAERVLERLFDVSCDTYDGYFLIVPILLQLEFAFLKPWDIEEEEDHNGDEDNWREWELRSLHEKYLPRLQEIADEDDDRPDILKTPDIREPLNQALQKLNWVDAEAEAGNMKMSILQPRIRDACLLLRDAGLVEADAVIEIYIPIFDDFWRGFIRNVRNPGSETLPEFFIPVTEAIMSYFAWPFFLLASLDYKADLVQKLLETIDTYLRESPEPLKSLEDLCELIQDFEERGILAWGKILGIWEFLSEQTCLKAKFDELKGIWDSIWQYYHSVTINLDLDQGGLNEQTNVLKEIRDVLLEMKADQDAQQEEVQEVLEQHRLAAQNYVTENEELFTAPEPEPFDASPFKELPSGTTRKDQDDGGVVFFLPDGTLLRVNHDKSYSAVIPGAEAIENLSLQNDGKLHLSDGRKIEVIPETITETAEDEHFSGLPDGTTVTNRVNCREVIMPDGASVRYFSEEDLVKVALLDGSECLITFPSVRGLGTKGEMSRVSEVLRRFSFDNQVVGTVDWNAGYEINMPNGAVVNINREPPTDSVGTYENVPSTPSTFTCEEDES